MKVKGSSPPVSLLQKYFPVAVTVPMGTVATIVSVGPRIV